MERIQKMSGAQLEKAAEAEALEKINRFALEPLTAEQIFTFAVNLCDDQLDRDGERFTLGALQKLAELFPGKPMIFDHIWSAGKQTARIYEASVQQDGGVNRLRAGCYMLKNEQTEPLIAAIRGGILREVSVGCAVAKRTCSICGEDYCGCGHQRGEQYGGKICEVLLDDAIDAYEASFVAVPAQPGAGVTKSASARLFQTDGEKEKAKHKQKQRALARLRMYQRLI